MPLAERTNFAVQLPPSNSTVRAGTAFAWAFAATPSTHPTAATVIFTATAHLLISLAPLENFRLAIDVPFRGLCPRVECALHVVSPRFRREVSRGSE
jgi:hypothetical protein